MLRTSCWKVDNVEKLTPDIKTYPLGTLAEVRRKILDVKNVKELHSMCSDEGIYNRFIWDSSVLMVVLEADSKTKQVSSIVLINTSDVKEFYILYLQLYELFGVTLLDEDNEKFIPIRTYKKLYF
jgi:hypothetical protein